MHVATSKKMPFGTKKKTEKTKTEKTETEKKKKKKRKKQIK